MIDVDFPAEITIIGISFAYKAAEEILINIKIKITLNSIK